MDTLLQDIELGAIVSKFQINNNIIKIRYKTGNVVSYSEHIWLSDIVVANNIKLEGTIGCYEHGIGYISIVLYKNGAQIKSDCNGDIFQHNCEINRINIEAIGDDDQFDNLVFSSQDIFNIDDLKRWNKKGKVIVAIDDVISEDIISLLIKHKLYYNIRSISSNIVASSDGTRIDYKINILEIVNINYDCIFRSSEPIRNEECQSCNNSMITINVYECSVHGDCIIGGSRYTSCVTCADRKLE